MDANRFLVNCGLVALASALALAGLMGWQQARVLNTHDAQVREQVRTTQRLVEAHHREALSDRAEQLAGDPAFAGYVEQAMGGALPGMSVDTTSIVDLLRERQGQLGLAASAVLDRNGRVIASTMPMPDSGTLQGDALFARARSNVALATGVWTKQDALMHVAVLPLAAVGVSEGFLLVAEPLDLRFAQTIATATGADVLLHQARGGVVTSTLSPEARDAFPADALRGGTSMSVDVDGATRPVFGFPLLESEQARLIVVAPDAPRTALAAAARLPWLIAGALWLLGVIGGGWLLWRRVLGPVDGIAGRLDRASGGDYHLQFPENAAGSMLPLASAFNRLMASLRA